MTYTFKLSTRLALLRSSIVTTVLLTSACIDSDLGSMSPLDRVGTGADGNRAITAQRAATDTSVGPKGVVRGKNTKGRSTYPAPVDSQTTLLDSTPQSLTFTVPTASAPSPVTSTGPTATAPSPVTYIGSSHEPASGKVVYRFDSTTTLAGLVVGKNYGNTSQSNLTGSTGKFRITYPTGLETGTSPISPFDMVEQLYPASTPAYGSWYLRVKVTLVGTNWISQSTGTKILYFTYGTRSQNNTGMLGFNGPQNGNNNDPQQEFLPVIQMSRDLYGGSVLMTPNVPGQVGVKSLKVGGTHVIEVRGMMGTANNFDAEIHMWVDGVEVMNYSPTSPYPYPDCYPSNPWQHPLCQSRVKLKATTDGNFTENFYGIHFDPVWGGNGGLPLYRSRNDYMDISEVVLKVE